MSLENVFLPGRKNPVSSKYPNFLVLYFYNFLLETLLFKTSYNQSYDDLENIKDLNMTCFAKT